jgi:hypothetical protein
VAAVLVSWEAVAVLRSGGHLVAGRNHLEDARRELFSGNLTDATADFDRARTEFETAAAAASSGPGWVPVLGNSLDVARGLGEAGERLAGAGAELGAALDGLPDGIGSLAPSRGRIPLPVYAGLAAALQQASDDAHAALDALDQTPESFVIGPVREARWDAQDRVEGVVRAMVGADALVRGVESFAGGAGERRYLVVAQNPAELRGTGGIWGAAAVLTLREGRPSFGPVRPTQSFAKVAADRVPAPSPDYRQNYDQYGGAGSWQNMNSTPDFPSAARAALGNYAIGEGQRLDGVIAADPLALQALMGVTGSVAVPGTEHQVSAEDVVDFTANRAYSMFDGPTNRKEALGSVAIDVLERFLAIEGKGLARFKAIGEAMSGGHLLIYTTDQTFERGLVLLGAGGAFGRAPSDEGDPADLVAVTVNSGSGNKVDFYATRSVSYDVTLGGDRESQATLTTSIDNEAPTSGAPRYVLGPFVRGLGPGDQLPLITVSCDPCDLTSAMRDGAPISVATGTELGVRWYRDYRRIAAGETGTLALSWHGRGVWEGNGSGGSYRLVFLGQPTIQPTDLRISITAPPGTKVVWTSEPMAIDGSTAVWQGTPVARTVLEIRFQAPLLLRWWRDVVRPFGGR